MFIKHGDAKFVGVVKPEELTKEQKESVEKTKEDIQSRH